MQVNLYYDYASIIITIFLLIYFGTTKKTSDFHNRVFMILIITNSLTSIFDLINKYLIFHKAASIYLEITSLGYFLTHLSILPLFFFFILAFIKNWYELKKRFKILVILPILLMYIILLSNPLTHLMYNYSSDGNYERGRGYAALYFVVLFYIVLMIFLLIHYKNYFSLVKRLASVLSLMIVVLSIFIQSMNYNLRMESFGITYGLLILFFFVQNPHDQTDKETGLYNKRSFYDVMRIRLAEAKNFNIIEVIVTDLKEIRKNPSNENNSVACQIADFLLDIEGDIDVYRVENNLFCLELRNFTDKEIIGLIRNIRNRFTKSWDKDGYEIVYKVKMCHISVPDDVNKISSLSGIIAGSVVNDLNKELLSVSDFDLGHLERKGVINSVIASALEKENVDLLFSPICNVSDKIIVAADTTGKIYGGEAGIISYREIINFVEEHGKFAALFKLLFIKLCEFVSSGNLDKAGFNLIAIELPLQVCYQPGLTKYIINEVYTRKINSSMIAFKLSEYTVYKSTDQVKKIMEELGEHGFKFCLYDYGSGFTNLASVYELNFDMIMINSDVIKAALKNEKAKITFKSSLDLIKELGMMTVVNGVDNADLFKLISEMGCEYASGSYCLEDISANEIINLVRSLEVSKMETSKERSGDETMEEGGFA